MSERDNQRIEPRDVTRAIRLTIFESTKRPLRRGHWARWTIECVTTTTPGPQWTESLASGWTRRIRFGGYMQFDLGAETETSQQLEADAMNAVRKAAA